MSDYEYGIVGMELYIPKLFISQEEFESAKNISKGKITKGLGQDEMSFVSELEDVNSMALTVMKNLMTRLALKTTDIGKLEFGTETFHDKSKSSKTILMKLLNGNKNVEGVTNLNACYGGTAAIFNCLNWLRLESHGKLAIVVMSDVAVYDTISAKPTGGCGAIALLLGPNPLITLKPIRNSFFADEYDFYKPHMESEYPVVNGHYSMKLFSSVLNECYEGFKAKHKEQNNTQINLKNFDYFCFHCPFTKQVEKGFLNLFYKELTEGNYNPSNMTEYKNFMQEKPKFEEQLTQRYLREMLQQELNDKLAPSFALSRKVGNIYTGSLYLCLMSLIFAKEDAHLRQKRVLMYSYGAGVSASIFELELSQNFSKKAFLGLENLTRMFVERKKIPIDSFDILSYKRESSYNATHINNKPDIQLIRPDTYYLQSVDSFGKRQYVLFTETDSRIVSIANNFKNGKSDQKFRKMALEDKVDFINHETGLKISKDFQDGGLNYAVANLMTENCIGTLKLPLGVAIGFFINNKKRIIPMMTEEPSVVAAASNAATLIGKFSTGFKSISSKNIIRGHLYLEKAKSPNSIFLKIANSKAHLINYLNTNYCKTIVENGGGVVDIKVVSHQNDIQSIEVYFDVQNAMGANSMNTVLEALKPKIIKLCECEVVMAIVSNLSPERIIKSFFEVPVSCLTTKEMKGEEVARKIILATEIAKNDLFRATTHNKGIMNGIDAVAMAVGQDVRAIEASCHAYSIFKNGKYGPLTSYYFTENGRCLRGEIEIPFLVGTAGGVTKMNRLYQLNLKLLENPDSRELGNIMACVGLAQNFAALRKLVSEGIQQGHMKLHAQLIAVSLGMEPEQVPEADEYMKKTKRISYESAKEFLKFKKEKI